MTSERRRIPAGLASRASEASRPPRSPLQKTRRRFAETILKQRALRIYPIRVARRLLWWHALAGVWKGGLMAGFLSICVVNPHDLNTLGMLHGSMAAVILGLALHAGAIHAERSSKSTRAITGRSAVIFAFQAPRRQTSLDPQERAFVWPALVLREMVVAMATIAAVVVFA